MAEQIASLILAHNLYTTSARGLQNDILRACDSIGLPTDDAFETDLSEFKQHNQKVYTEMDDITKGFGTPTNNAELLTQTFHFMRDVAAGGVAQPSEIVEVQERVKQEAYRMLEAMIAKAEETTGGNAGAAAAREAAGPSTSALSIGSSMGGKAGVAPPSGSGGPTGG